MRKALLVSALVVAAMVTALASPAAAVQEEQEAAAQESEEAPAQEMQQEAGPTPTHSIVRFFKCERQGLAVQMFQRGRAVAEEMIAEGKFIDYGILTHNWGDEWNVVDYFVVDGLGSFFGNFGEFFSRVNEANEAAEAAGEEELPPFNEVCQEHKDNIYSVVPPPEDE